MSASAASTLTEVLEFFRPFASEALNLVGGAALHTPQTNVLALNAAYLPPDVGELPPNLRAWWRERQAPPLVLAARAWPGEDVGGLRVGTYIRRPDPGGIAVEQVSRLHLATWAGVLAESYDTPEWGSALARHFAACLEGERTSVLLLAYAGSEVVGALLWRDLGKRGAGSEGGAHLWGTLDPAADTALLNAAAELSGGRVRVSLPDASPLSVTDEEVLTFTRLEG
ncbi:hypothetical protein [Deinococcus reticulitermitis]|uniref:hypothetical protein n=1 Tax=Deinococcus reticulitermitis TaxID=856736 RepID=UPI001FE1A66F|nr:hypothetical protein [Deinococcus reticulitermitis]